MAVPLLIMAEVHTVVRRPTTVEEAAGRASAARPRTAAAAMVARCRRMAASRQAVVASVAHVHPAVVASVEGILQEVVVDMLRLRTSPAEALAEVTPMAEAMAIVNC